LWAAIACWFLISFILRGLKRLTHAKFFDKALHGVAARRWFGFVSGAVVLILLGAVIGPTESGG
jgi:hypothetical protein